MTDQADPGDDERKAMNDDDGDQVDPRERAKKMDRIRQILQSAQLAGGFDKVHPDVKDELRRLHFELTGHHLMIAQRWLAMVCDPEDDEDRGPLQ